MSKDAALQAAPAGKKIAPRRRAARKPRGTLNDAAVAKAISHVLQMSITREFVRGRPRPGDERDHDARTAAWVMARSGETFEAVARLALEDRDLVDRFRTAHRMAAFVVNLLDFAEDYRAQKGRRAAGAESAKEGSLARGVKRLAQNLNLKVDEPLATEIRILIRGRGAKGLQDSLQRLLCEKADVSYSTFGDLVSRLQGRKGRANVPQGLTAQVLRAGFVSEEFSLEEIGRLALTMVSARVHRPLWERWQAHFLLSLFHSHRQGEAGCPSPRRKLSRRSWSRQLTCRTSKTMARMNRGTATAMSPSGVEVRSALKPDTSEYGAPMLAPQHRTPGAAT